MKGKEKCRILKQIRREIAASNDIAFATEECKFRGECTGTCPKCEQELRYLEQELEKRRHMGKKIVVAGIATAMLVSGAGCSETPQESISQTFDAGMTEWMGVPSYTETAVDGLLEPPTETTELSGNIEIMGEVPEETQPTEIVEMMGDLVVAP